MNTLYDSLTQLESRTYSKYEINMINKGFPIDELPLVHKDYKICLNCRRYISIYIPSLSRECYFSFPHNFCNLKCLDSYCTRTGHKYCKTCYQILYPWDEEKYILMPGYIKLTKGSKIAEFTTNNFPYTYHNRISIGLLTSNYEELRPIEIYILGERCEDQLNFSNTARLYRDWKKENITDRWVKIDRVNHSNICVCALNE